MFCDASCQFITEQLNKERRTIRVIDAIHLFLDG